MYIAAYLLSGVLAAIRGRWTIGRLFEVFYQSFPEMFMLRLTASVNGVGWFTAALLVSGGILYAGLVADRNRIFRGIVCPIGALFIYGCFARALGRIHFPTTQELFPPMYDGIMRALAGMALGIFLFELVYTLHRIRFNPRAKRWMGALGHLSFMLLLGASILHYHSFFDFWFIFLAFCAVLCLVLAGQEGFFHHFFVRKVVNFFGELSYPIYLLHAAVFGLLKTYGWTDSPLRGCFMVLTFTFLEAMLLHILLHHMGQCLFPKCKALLLDNSKVEDS